MRELESLRHSAVAGAGLHRAGGSSRSLAGADYGAGGAEIRGAFVPAAASYQWLVAANLCPTVLFNKVWLNKPRCVEDPVKVTTEKCQIADRLIRISDRFRISANRMPLTPVFTT
jgi:hypothetical protein